MENTALITVEETSSPKYPPRTFFNAKNADVTFAIAVDFQTAGELLTAKAAGEKKLIQVHAEHPPLVAAKALWRHMDKIDAFSINVAGNGIYTFDKHGWSQERLDAHVYAILSALHEKRPIPFIRTGGQTGADWSGAVAAIALGIPVIVTYPNGFIRKFKDGSTKKSTKDQIISELTEAAKKVLGAEPPCRPAKRNP